MPAPTNTVPAMAGAAAVLASSPDGSTYTTIANLQEIVPGEVKKATPKVSSLASPFGGSTPYQEFAPLGWADPGEMTANAFFTKAGYAAILILLQTNVLYFYKLTFNKLSTESVSGSTFQSAGILSSQALTALNTDDDNIVMMPIKMKFSGVPVFTSGS